MKNTPDNPQQGTPSFSHLKKQVQDKAINKSNFTEFVVASMEGELNPAGEVALNRFLSDYPECATEARLLALCIAPLNTEICFPDKESLFQSVRFSPDQFGTDIGEEQLVAFLEGDLPAEEHDGMVEFLNRYPEMNLRVEQYKQTYLVPDLNVVFPDKDALKQGALVVSFNRRVWLTGISIAASVALLIGIYLQMPDIAGNRGYFPVSPLASLIESELPSDNTTSLNINRDKVTGKEGSEHNLKLKKTYPAKPVMEESLLVAASRQPEPLPGKFSPRPLPGTIGSISKTAPAPAPSSLLAAIYPPEISRHERLTIKSFPEELRYYTGGGNEKPGVLADLSFARIADATNAHEFINSAGQNLYQRWEDWKERSLDAVLPFR